MPSAKLMLRQSAINSTLHMSDSAVTVGKVTHAFTLDREIGNFILTHENLRIPEDSSEFAINTSNERFWEPPVARYVEECKAGKTGKK